MLDEYGLLYIHSGTKDIHARDFRSLAIMGRNTDDVPESVFNDLLDHAGRNHYYMYALEGMLNMGYEKEVARRLKPVTVDTASLLVPNAGAQGSDTTATAQAACLRLRLDMPADSFIQAVRAVVNPDGSLPHDKTDTRKIAWACKYYLDMEKLLENPVVRTPRKPKSKRRDIGQKPVSGV
jgi:hypothetical protein